MVKVRNRRPRPDCMRLTIAKAAQGSILPEREKFAGPEEKFANSAGLAWPVCPKSPSWSDFACDGRSRRRRRRRSLCGPSSLPLDLYGKPVVGDHRRSDGHRRPTRATLTGQTNRDDDSFRSYLCVCLFSSTTKCCACVRNVRVARRLSRPRCAIAGRRFS